MAADRLDCMLVWTELPLYLKPPFDTNPHYSIPGCRNVMAETRLTLHGKEAREFCTERRRTSSDAGHDGGTLRTEESSSVPRQGRMAAATLVCATNRN